MSRSFNTAAVHGLVWCLVVMLPWLGLGMVQRQALGPLHVHAMPAATSVHTGAEALHQALDWWWARVQQQAHARQHAQDHAQDHALSHAHGHSHDGWQRHHHEPGDASVMALDAPGEDLGAQAAAASWLLALGAPAGGLRVAVVAAAGHRWPLADAARFGSWGTAPPLRPPRG